jgi:hypothetical protein
VSRWRRAVDLLVNGPLPERRIVRGLLIGLGLSTPGLVQLIPDTRAGWRIVAYMAGGLAGCVGGLIGVGEPNEPTVKP